MPTHDVVVAGAGHNSLTTAAYAARAGFSVGVVEYADRIGGNTGTEELTVPGLKQDTCSTAHGLIQASPTLENYQVGLLSDYGLDCVRPDPVFVFPLEDGTSLTMWRDLERTAEEFAKFSEADARAYLDFLDDYEEVAPFYTEARFTPPRDGSIEETIARAPNGDQWVRRSREHAWAIIERRFAHEKTRRFVSALASEEVQPIDRPLGGLLAFGIVYGRQTHSWIMPRGGSGKLPDALADCIVDHGGEIYTDQPIEAFHVECGRAVGVRARDGTTYRAREAVVSTVHVKHLVEMFPEEHVPDDFRASVKRWKTGGTRFTAHYAISEAPRYTTEDEPTACVAMSTVGSVDAIFEANHAFDRGRLDLENAVVLALSPTVADETRMAGELHSLKILAELPYALDRDVPWAAIGDEVAATLLVRVREFAPNLTDEVIVDATIDSPVDLERRNPHNYRGSCHGGSYDPSQYGDHRPVKGYGNYRGPVDGLYLTGACTFPGGSWSAAPGRDCAVVLLEDLGPGIEAAIRRP